MEPEKLLEALHTAEKLKDTTRHCYTSKGRHESVAEHSWRIALMAFWLRDEFSQADMDKVIRMCLIHDLGECFTGDIPAFDKTAADMERAAQTISEKYGCAVLCKGGHQINDADDLLWRDGAGKWFKGRRIDNPNTHGTGCTLSSAIASNLAKGYDLDTSVESAKAYISGALAAMLDLGHGSGPMNHMFALKGDFVE